MIMNLGAEGAENFVWALEIVNLFSPNPWQMSTFLNPLDALIPKIPFSFLFLPNFGSGSPPGPRGQSREDLGGRGGRQLSPWGGVRASQRAVLTPPHPCLKARPPQGGPLEKKREAKDSRWLVIESQPQIGARLFRFGPICWA